jgi:hypothetical protein
MQNNVPALTSVEGNARFDVRWWKPFRKAEVAQKITNGCRATSWRRARRAVCFIILSGYFTATTGIKEPWYCQITYVSRFIVTGFSTASQGLPA